MSYDTTVHEALEPPQPRVVDAVNERLAAQPRTSGRKWRRAIVTALSLCALSFAAWVIAALAAEPTDPAHGAAEGDYVPNATQNVFASEP